MMEIQACRQRFFKSKQVKMSSIIEFDYLFSSCTSFPLGYARRINKVSFMPSVGACWEKPEILAKARMSRPRGKQEKNVYRTEQALVISAYTLQP